MNFGSRACGAIIFISTLCAAAPVSESPPFEFHSNFWINLHHFLYQQAIHPDTLTTGLNASELAAWRHALAFYRQSMIPHDLLRDLDMISLDAELAANENSPALAHVDQDPALAGTLNAVAPIYKAYWWPAHDRANRAFVAAASPLVARYGAALTKQLATAYETPWPKGAIYVDIAEYANWAGAYTFTERGGRVHTIVSSADPANKGNAALEILFHEATHGFVSGTSGRLADRIAAAAQRDQVAVPRDLVHIFIFYTAGELTRRDLAANGDPAYVPYADLKHLYRANWQPWHDSIEIYWKQHLDGRLALNDAVDKVIVEEGKATAKHP